MRNTYLVAYDVSDKKRLRLMHRKMLGFGDPIQYSLFRCLLSPREKLLLVDSAKEIMNQDSDRVMIVNLGPEGGTSDLRVEFLGVMQDFDDKDVVIV